MRNFVFLAAFFLIKKKGLQKEEERKKKNNAKYYGHYTLRWHTLRSDKDVWQSLCQMINCCPIDYTHQKMVSLVWDVENNVEKHVEKTNLKKSWTSSIKKRFMLFKVSHNLLSFPPFFLSFLFSSIDRCKQIKW